MKIYSKYKETKEFFQGILDCLEVIFPESKRVFADKYLIILDDLDMNKNAVEIIKQIEPIEISNQYLEIFRKCEKANIEYVKKGETNSYFFPILISKNDKYDFQGIILKPHQTYLFEIDLIDGKRRNHRFQYTNTNKMFGFFVNLLINMNIIEFIDEVDKAKINDRLVENLLKKNKNLKFQSRSVIQMISSKKDLDIF